MFDPEANLGASPTSSPTESIAQWKNAVQNYFSGEWDNLRELIRELEERDWDNARLEIPEEEAQPRKTRVPFHQQIGEQLRRQAEVQQQAMLEQQRILLKQQQVREQQSQASAQPTYERRAPSPELSSASVRSERPMTDQLLPSQPVPKSVTPAADARESKPSRLAELARRLEQRLKESAPDA